MLWIISRLELGVVSQLLIIALASRSQGVTTVWGLTNSRGFNRMPMNFSPPRACSFLFRNLKVTHQQSLLHINISSWGQQIIKVTQVLTEVIKYKDICRNKLVSKNLIENYLYYTPNSVLSLHEFRSKLFKKSFCVHFMRVLVSTYTCIKSNRQAKMPMHWFGTLDLDINVHIVKLKVVLLIFQVVEMKNI